MPSEGETKRCTRCGTGTMTYSDSHVLPGHTKRVAEGDAMTAASRFAGWLCSDPKCRWYEILRLNHRRLTLALARSTTLSSRRLVKSTCTHFLQIRRT